MRHDEQVVVTDAFKHALGGFNWIHGGGHQIDGRRALNARRWCRRLGRAWIDQRGRTVALGIEDIGTHRARTEHRHANVLTFNFHAQRFHHAHHRIFGGDVQTQHGSHEACCRTGGHDVCAFAMGLHTRQKGANAVEHARHVHVHRPIPIVPTGIAELRVDAYAGVIDQQMHIAKHRLSFIGRAHHAVAISRV